MEVSMAQKVSEVLSHWHHLIEGQQESSQRFYSLLSEAVERRKIPNLTTDRVQYREGGIFTSAREYFRMHRAGYVFDVCAAPFGNSFFVSWWFGISHPSPIGPTLVLLVLLALLYYLMNAILFFIVLLVAFIAVGALMGDGSAEWCGYVLAIPFLGSLYIWLFLPVTYFKIDTETMFQELVHSAVKETVDTMREAKGMKMLTEQETKPIMRDIFKR